MPGPNASGFASQWNIGLNIYIKVSNTTWEHENLLLVQSDFSVITPTTIYIHVYTPPKVYTI